MSLNTTQTAFNGRMRSRLNFTSAYEVRGKYMLPFCARMRNLSVEEREELEKPYVKELLDIVRRHKLSRQTSNTHGDAPSMNNFSSSRGDVCHSDLSSKQDAEFAFSPPCSPRSCPSTWQMDDNDDFFSPWKNPSAANMELRTTPPPLRTGNEQDPQPSSSSEAGLLSKSSQRMKRSRYEPADNNGSAFVND
ncbi:hypothetical protein KIN20_024133 [Parelaphostrongylus tenuis]|uniref:Uncharacterized protein n=1 Tax=Parelaphostrongylus tenuis TaxID=148309 RepID=A0AAD5N789_PARTN|nr:hypothetical protein KIN20_024133 [Parelaphostrongylus tenuis]